MILPTPEALHVFGYRLWFLLVAAPISFVAFVLVALSLVPVVVVTVVVVTVVVAVPVVISVVVSLGWNSRVV